MRAAWRVMVAGALNPRRLVFVDECGTHTSLAPVYGYSPKGERLRLRVPRNRGKNTTLLASMTVEGMGPSLAVKGSTTAEVFEAYLEHALLPELEEGQVVVMDNLPAHKPKRVRELIEERGCELLYLPSYSPDYNPIEEAFSKIKEILRRAEARTREALVEAMGEALSGGHYQRMLFVQPRHPHPSETRFTVRLEAFATVSVYGISALAEERKVGMERKSDDL